MEIFKNVIEFKGVQNVPEYARAEGKVIVYREVEGEKWFYGAYNTLNRALEVCYMVDGRVLLED